MKLLVAIAGVQTAKDHAATIFNFAQKMDAEIYALHVKPPFAEDTGESALEFLAREGAVRGVNVHRLLWKGDVATTILTVAAREHADMILMGASGAYNVNDWASGAVMEKAMVPVIVLPHQRVENRQAA